MNINKGDLFAVQSGDYVGQMFAVVDLTTDVIDCLSVPDMKNVNVTKEKFDFGRNNGIIEYVDTHNGCLSSNSRSIYKKCELSGVLTPYTFTLYKNNRVNDFAS